MKLTDRTRNILRSRKYKRDMKKNGYMLCEPHWQLLRGDDIGKKLVEAVIDIDGCHIWYKVG